MSEAQIERDQFSARLVQVLVERGQSDSPTTLVRMFNAYYAGTPISVHAARKWIMGESIPTQEKIKALARALRVDPSWLRFGTAAKGEVTHDDNRLSERDMQFLCDMHLLNDEGQEIALDLLRALARRYRREAS